MSEAFWIFLSGFAVGSVFWGSLKAVEAWAQARLIRALTKPDPKRWVSLDADLFCHVWLHDDASVTLKLAEKKSAGWQTTSSMHFAPRCAATLAAGFKALNVPVKAPEDQP
jgi:hypothetical protein